MIEFESEILSPMEKSSLAKIKVIGIGGGGGNMVNSMIDTGFDNITFIVANTDAQALKFAKAPYKIQLGVKSTKGLGAGANPEIGRRSAEEDLDRIIDLAKDADIVFLACGLGGGTGSGAAPVIARALREKDILTVAAVTKPFTFEGKRRKKIADDSLELLKREVDTLIVLPNQKLIDVVNEKVSLIDAFAMINNVLGQFIRAVADTIDKPGHINVDFADIKTIMKHKGLALIGIGKASGEDRAYMAALQAISSPLLENVDISGAQGILINIIGGTELGLHELSQASSLVYEKAHEEANIVLGSVIDETMSDEVIVTVIATGFSDPNHISAESEKNLYQKDEKIISSVRDNLENSNAFYDNIKEPLEKVDTIDLTDLDVPAIMRKIAQQRQI